MSTRGAPSRRQEKVARVIRESVSDTIRNHLNDPRIEGLISVTEVDVSPDLRNAEVYLSILAPDEKVKLRTLEAIRHASRPIQTRLGHALTSKYVPHLTFHEDVKLKKTLETLSMIETISQELRERDGGEAGEEPSTPDAEQEPGRAEIDEEQ